ncbi:ankyrin repeat-containing domain protein [Podospora aff. communis PSN243]|uniref:Ankyrin repeat-containing domain protein n=1 Tax=Podospora aff. communis PSN243 TaxID=3040156 RepID=A0AAV9GJV4_9PEZI|nr:ankyrin repeat-containing domain protein [Podospora aff. communis PSN243]
MSIEASHSATLAQLGDQLQSMEHRILTTVQKSPDAGQKPGPLKQKELCFSSGPRRGSRCDINCTCQCHDDAKFSWKMNMALFQSVVGIAAVAYSSWGSRRCTNPSCRESDSPGNQRPVRDIQVVYHLPDWLSRVSVSLFVSNNLNGSPQMQLRVYNRRAWGDGWNSGGLLRLIDGGDVEGIKAAFRNSQATVYDLYGPGCATPLWAAFQTNDIELVSILLQAGADPFYRLDPPNGRSVMDLAFQISNTTIPEYVALASLFPVSRYIEDLDIPNIHLAVIKNAHSLLSSSLQKTTASINQPITPNEYAPLHLAAMRGDVTAVRLLIRYGATLDVPTKLGVPPLYFASLYGNHSVVSALLLTGADPNQPDNLGRRPLHGAATARTNSAKIMSLLLQHGADINARMPGIDPFTPLSMAISYGDVESTEFLFSRGADPEQGCAMSFNFPMQVAIERGDCAKAELLLKHGAEVNAVGERDGTGLLHHLAMSGTEGLMRLFMVPRNLERLRGVKTALKDGAGKTPMVLFDERVEKAEGLRKGFEALLDAVEGLDRELVEDEEEDVFFDAVSGDGLGDVTG